ncbi:pilus assembly protein PilZ [Methylobacterium planeticum]|uniref:Pilus assembly protein PilZ n=1 Tax=Methylobacterium planeticum TaxID=2615211 RepID=A0A6N6MPK7_9HYPH|nr:pilus assembly protein PilZ [Methylobacterium planeticum]KAB1072945.1 pilus assembly protein PilZ [Methylobacterium planeticum]
MFVERRAAVRRDALVFGRLFFHEAPQMHDCLVWTASELGALIEVEPGIDVPDRFHAVIPSLGIDRDAMIVWRDGRRIGVAYIR